MVKIEVPRVSLRSSRLLLYCRILSHDGQELYPANLNQSRIGDFAAPEFQGSSGKPRRREAKPRIIPHVSVCYLLSRPELCASQSNGSTSFHRRKRGKVRSAPPHHVGVPQTFSSSYQGGSGSDYLSDSFLLANLFSSVYPAACALYAFESHCGRLCSQTNQAMPYRTKTTIS